MLPGIREGAIDDFVIEGVVVVMPARDFRAFLGLPNSKRRAVHLADLIEGLGSSFQVVSLCAEYYPEEVYHSETKKIYKQRERYDC